MTMKSTIFALGSRAGCRGGAGRRRASAQAEQVPPPELQVVVRRSVRHLRPGAAAARLQDLPRGLLELPLAEPAVVPQPRRGGRPGFTEAQVGRSPPSTRSRTLERPGRMSIERTGRPADHFPPPFANELAAKAATAASRRPTCRCSPRRAPTSAASPGSCSTSSRNTRRRGRTTSPPS